MGGEDEDEGRSKPQITDCDCTAAVAKGVDVVFFLSFLKLSAATWILRGDRGHPSPRGSLRASSPARKRRITDEETVASAFFFFFPPRLNV